MAHLQRLSPSSHVLTLKDGTRVLFSYDTPVAAWTGPLMMGGGYIKTSVFHSRTTSGHIARFIQGGHKARAVDQAVLDSLVAGV